MWLQDTQDHFRGDKPNRSKGEYQSDKLIGGSNPLALTNSINNLKKEQIEFVSFTRV